MWFLNNCKGKGLRACVTAQLCLGGPPRNSANQIEEVPLQRLNGCSDRSAFSGLCVQTSLRNTRKWKIIFFNMPWPKFIRYESSCTHMKQNPALIWMTRAPDHVNNLKIAISLSLLSFSTDQFKKAARPLAQYSTWNTKRKKKPNKTKQGIFLIPIIRKEHGDHQSGVPKALVLEKTELVALSVRQQVVPRLPVVGSTHWLFWRYLRTKHKVPFLPHQTPPPDQTHAHHAVLLATSAFWSHYYKGITGLLGKRAIADHGAPKLVTWFSP